MHDCTACRPRLNSQHNTEPHLAESTPISPHTTRAVWVMLFALTTAVALSQAFRTVAAIMAAPLQADFH
jgi:hypothetical protein